MGKTIKRAACLFIATVILFAATSTLCACDVLGDFLVKIVQSSSDNEESTHKVEIKSGNEINKLVSANDVISKKQHSKIVKDSWYDDEDNYNYIIYLGRINNFLLHNVYSFQYTKNFKVFGDAQITLKQATEETVKTAYTKTVQKSTSRTVEDSLKAGLEIPDSIFKDLLGESVKVSMESQIKNVFSVSCTETDSSSFSKITTQTQEIIREFTLDYSKCVVGETYSYCVVTDVDVYAAICYNSKTSGISYSYYSNAVGNFRDVVFSSADEYFDGNFDTFEFDFSDISFEKPDKFISNHPDINYTFVGKEILKITPYSVTASWYTFGERVNSKGEKVPTFKYYKQLGYTKIKIEVSFNYVKHGEGRLYLYICPTSDYHYRIAEYVDGAEGRKNLCYDNLDLNEFVNYNKIYFDFESKYIKGYEVNGLTINITIYK